MSRWVVSLSLVNLLTLGACASSPSQPNSMSTDEAYPELRRRIVETGRLQVIVGVSVDAPERPESIRESLDELIDSLPSEHVEEASRFESIPFIVLRVNAAGLDALIASALVTSIEEDETSGPSL